MRRNRATRNLAGRFGVANLNSGCRSSLPPNLQPADFPPKCGMTHSFRLITLIFALALPCAADPGIRDATPDITEADLRAQIGYLASDALEGRLTGTEGEKLATAYVAKAFEMWGLAPYDERPASISYFQPFEFTAGVDLGPENELWIEEGAVRRKLALNEDWRPLSFSQLGKIAARDIVFAGYGMDVPAGQASADGTQSELYTSYYHTDVKDKWVLMLRFIPEELTGEKRRTFMRYASLRYKAMLARQKAPRA